MVKGRLVRIQWALVLVLLAAVVLPPGPVLPGANASHNIEAGGERLHLVLAPPSSGPGADERGPHDPEVDGEAPAVEVPVLPEQVRVKVAPDLLRQVLEASPAETFRFLVTARVGAELAGVPLVGPSEERRAAVVERLQSAAAASQAGLRPALSNLSDAGHVQAFRPFWIFNGLAVTGDREALLKLAARDDVLSIRPDRWLQWIPPDQALPSSVSSPTGVDWGISQIRADQVWSALEIDGTGVVVATMDTGVDWQHPWLQPAYRGWHGGTAIHTGNWFDATGGGALYPVDSMGHGTHVTGLLAGQEGVGVAPGARWIAVRAFNNRGYALDSWLHGGFQWLLAPEGDPALAPDIVSSSWSSPVGGNTEFLPDVQALVAAGILPLFAAGNSGPRAGSIGAPASYLESLAAGASDPDDEVAYFSGRGPSPFGGIKPEVVAPGVNLRSALPGGAEGTMSGTSMATPLVAGVAAMALQADPALGPWQVVSVITSTALPIGDPWPNADAGWGRVDALGAVASVLNPGYLEGHVSSVAGDPLAGATVRASEHGGGATAAAQTGADGSWSLAVSPGLYDLEAMAFGYAPGVATGLSVLTGTVTTRDFALALLPTGVVEGHVTATDNGDPLAAVVRALGTPVTTTASLSGSYSLTLPSGTYTLTAEQWGYRIGRAAVAVQVVGVSQQDFQLNASPELLLVDSGAWYYGSEIGYFRDALYDRDYLYHDWRIKYPPQDTPTVTDVLPYDAVIWSSPADSPGYVNAGEVISGYLTMGGSLLLSGQDVGYWDSGTSGLLWSPYYRERLKARLLSDDADSLVLTGTVGGLLDGLTLALNEPGGAENQASPDSVEPLSDDYAEPLLDYGSQSGAGALVTGASTSSQEAAGRGGVAAGLCLPYRSFYLSFGLEGVGEQTDRAEVMERALEWFESPRPEVGVELIPVQSRLIAPAGASATHTLRLRNTGEAGIGDSYTLTLGSSDWHATVLTPAYILSPCQTAEVKVRVDVPAGSGWDQADQVVLTARSALSPTLVATAVLTTKTPAPILLVDDDRWYDQESVYQAALEAAGFRYDVWDAAWKAGQQPAPPPAGTLGLYPITIWFTAYDWYAPITDQEAAGLEDYLEGGGRLFLSSQEALYGQAGAPLASRYLGVLTYREELTPTVALGGSGGLGLTGRLALSYPFNNLADGVIPAAGAMEELYDPRGWAIGLTNLGADWKTAFFAFPFEALPAEARPGVMDRTVGWLSWLGGSTFEASARTVPARDVVTFTATLRNDGPEATTAALSNTLPAGFKYSQGSLVGGSKDRETIYWRGTLPAGGEHTVRYAGTARETLTNTAVISYAEHGLAFHRPVQVWVDAPDLTPSSLTAEPAVVLPGERVTYTLLIRNGGPAPAPAASAAWTLPSELTLLTGTLQWTGGSANLEDQLVGWSGSVAAGQTITVTLTGLTLPSLEGRWLPSAAVLDDGGTELLVRANVLELQPALVYLPIVLRH